MNRVSFVITFSLFVVCRVVFSGAYSSYQDISFTATYDGSTQNYVEMLPDNFDNSQTHDIIIALHGHGSDRWQFVTSTRDECVATRDIAAQNNMIYISPDYRATTSWMGPAAEADMVQLITELKQQYNVGKIIITGGSMGGSSALTFTALHPDMIDGVSSLNGLANHMTYTNFQDAIATSFGGTKTEVPEQYYNRSAINFPSSFTMPFAVSAGGADTTVPPQSVLSLYDTVSASNSKTMEFYRPTTGHSTNYVDTAVALEYVIRQTHGVDASNPITINTSFESQMLSDGTLNSKANGWTVVYESSGAVGVVNPADSTYANAFNSSVPDGSNLAYAKNGSLFQYLGTQISEGIYTLTLKVASNKASENIATFLAGLSIADTNVADSIDDLQWASESSYDGSALTPGEWADIVLQLEITEGDSLIGKELYLCLHGTNSTYAYFDDVNVSFTPTPEPATISLLTIASVAALLRRKRVF